jgi:hypothetical protein
MAQLNSSINNVTTVYVMESNLTSIPISIQKKPSGSKVHPTERWSDMVEASPGVIDPKVLKGLSFSFGEGLTEEQFKKQQAKGKARVAKSLDQTDAGRKRQVLREQSFLLTHNHKCLASLLSGHSLDRNLPSSSNSPANQGW